MKLAGLLSDISISAPSPEVLDGRILGFLLILAPFNYPLFITLILFYAVGRAQFSFRGTDGFVLALLIVKLLWIATLSFLFKGYTTYDFLKVISIDGMLLFTLLLHKDRNFFLGLSSPVILAFLVDLTFNAFTLFTGVDAIGREIELRPGDVLPRAGGIYFSPFLSINLSLLALFFSALRGNRFVFLAALTNIGLNGSLRGPLSLLVLLAIFLAIKRRLSLIKLFALSAALVVSVFWITIASVDYLEFNLANYYRVFAWKSALEQIGENPVLGSHFFYRGDIESISEDTILQMGIAESLYLGYALHFGLMPAVLHFIVIYRIFSRSIANFYRSDDPHDYRLRQVIAVMAMFLLIDSCYGTFVGSLLTTLVFGFFTLSYRPHHDPAQDIPLPVTEKR